MFSLPGRVRWSFIDQVLVSGVSFVTGVILIRALGIEEFGVYSLILIGLQFLAGVQHSIILSPLMSMYDQRGDISPSRYLASMLVHQGALAALLLTIVPIIWLLPTSILPEVPISYATAAMLIVSMQFQDLARRYFFVTERAMLAFCSDLVAYGGRLAVIGSLALTGNLTTELVWEVMIAASAAGFFFLLPDLAAIRADKDALRSVTQRHGKMAGWMLGNMIVAWFSESGFVLMVIGSVLGPAEVGAVRAVQNLILVANLLIQSLENFVPSTASQRLVNGGPQALANYLTGVGVLGAVGILVIAAGLMLLATPIMELIYNHSFPNQVLILGMFGLFFAMGHINAVVYAGLRALEHLHSAFWLQLIIGIGCVVLTGLAAQVFGIVGALIVMLSGRFVMTSQLVLILQKRISRLSPEVK